MIKFYLTLSETIRFAKALAPCMSPDKTRYYLNGVLLDASREGLFAIAADGHRLGKFKLDMLDAECQPVTLEHNFLHILPEEAIKMLCKLKLVRGVSEYVGFEIYGGKVFIAIASRDLSVSFTLIDANFPDWRRLMPSYAPQAVVGFRAELLEKLCKAARDGSLNRHAVINMHLGNASSPATLEVNEVLSYVLMPARF